LLLMSFLCEFWSLDDQKNKNPVWPIQTIFVEKMRQSRHFWRIYKKIKNKNHHI
jgi:hypothetical protein